MDDKKYGQIFEKRDVKIFKKIHFARIRAQNEFSFEKKERIDVWQGHMAAAAAAAAAPTIVCD